MFKLYNTLTKQLEDIPKKDHLNLYTCGPTVYNYAHIGNLRAFILADLLYRTLKYQGYNPKWVMNITDVDDKTIKGTIEKYGKDAGVKELNEFTQFYLDEFLKDLREVNVLVDDIQFIRVTDKIKDIQEFIIKLMDKGYAYKEEDGVYFNIEKYQTDFGDYGELVGSKFLEGKKVGARVKVDEYEKENLSDFALWKGHTEADGNIFWDHPVLGKGRPGWHIECSVINHVAFGGEPIDIHTGGVDLVFPHHTNELAQSQALLGKGNFVKHWFHSEHLLVDGKKMSKSAENFYTLKDLLDKGFNGQDFRYSLLASSYRIQQNFTWENLLAAHETIVKLEGVILRSAADEESRNSDVVRALNDNLNTANAIGGVWKKTPISKTLDQLFGLKPVEPSNEIPSDISGLVTKRQQARDNKDFTASDDIRKQIEDLGYEVMDTPEGQKVKKKLQI